MFLTQDLMPRSQCSWMSGRTECMYHTTGWLEWADAAASHWGARFGLLTPSARTHPDRETGIRVGRQRAWLPWSAPSRSILPADETRWHLGSGVQLRNISPAASAWLW